MPQQTARSRRNSLKSNSIMGGVDPSSVLIPPGDSPLHHPYPRRHSKAGLQTDTHPIMIPPSPPPLPAASSTTGVSRMKTLEEWTLTIDKLRKEAEQLKRQAGLAESSAAFWMSQVDPDFGNQMMEMLELPMSDILKRVQEAMGGGIPDNSNNSNNNNNNQMNDDNMSEKTVIIDETEGDANEMAMDVPNRIVAYHDPQMDLNALIELLKPHFHQLEYHQ